ncbi:ATP-binding protein [Listeria seeligeri]|uniref:ATP-binding protein n=1 Tax=Listeria seeligeri TaxID=1640 RepID=UPI0010E78E92|nr:ATP-binding protein [Listeria seeligeri]MBC1578045.1 sensor histidine kinase [Listeria seeligeri]MBC1726235.1 sensor histidine kinase [Listeria seeligeri]MBC1731123.1 sensor histidine kinase [Listeria seeligeri]MBC1808924.1 sensor histidine kinase [Listeria seeligeri]MBC1894646.1 sensor histidine kinase [Listeria seeligeri]
MVKDIEVNFKATTRTVNLLGRDNVLDYRSAVLELVKNSYDAFSKSVKVIINESKIEIIDFGQGMSLETIKEVFFTIGTDDKAKTPSRRLNDKKRIMNGSMGIGRLSLGRLGKKSTVITSDGIQAHKFDVDWNTFITGAELSSIKILISNITLNDFENEYINRGLKNPEKKGTILISKELNDDWNRGTSNTVKDNYDLLKQSLGKLKNPLKTQGLEEFNISLNYFDEVEEIEYMMEDFSSDAFINFTYSHEDNLLIIEGDFSEIDMNYFPPDFIIRKFENLKEYIVKDGKRINKISFYKEIKINEFIPEKFPENPIGDFDGTIYFTKNTGGRRYPFIKEPAIKRYEFEYEPGISLYRDGFRIRPYGEKDTIGFDWLDIDTVRAKDPAGVARKTYLMQANQLSGFINITKEKNNAFEDQANREGLKKSPEFTYLKKTMLQIVKEFSKVRSNIHIWYKEYLKETSDLVFHGENGKSVKRKIERLLQKNNGDQSKLFKDPEYQKLILPETMLELYALSDITEEKNESLISESDMLRTLATQGVIMSTFAHQIKNDKLFFKNSSTTLRNMADFYSEKFGINFQKIDSKYNIIKFAESVERKNTSILGFIENATKNPTRAKKKNIHLVSYIQMVFRWWEDSIRDKYNKYSYTINGEKDISKIDSHLKEIFVYGSDQQLDCIFLNLISNSYKSFEEGSITCRKIDVKISMESREKVKIVYSDNGRGLNKKINNKNDIFEPYKSYGDNNQGTGMGMWILSSIIKSLNGDKDLISEIGNPGFSIKLVLLGGISDDKN